MSRPNALCCLDATYCEGRLGLVGVDEVGRGAIAGPVVAVALLVEAAFYKEQFDPEALALIQDSKALTPHSREVAFQHLKRWQSQNYLTWALGYTRPATVDRLNVFHATALAMRHALDLLRKNSPADFSKYLVLIDGLPMPSLPYEHLALPQADTKSFAVAGASIVAKLTRDARMARHAQAPLYGFGQHKGYGTSGHFRALKLHGPSAAHRRSFLAKHLR